MVTVRTDSIKLDLERMGFIYYGKQIINRKSALIVRKLITEGSYQDIIRSQENSHGVLLKNWRILDNSELKRESKFNSY